jgi:hypothetical protein
VSSTDWQEDPGDAERVDRDELEEVPPGSADVEAERDTVGTEGTAGVTDTDVTEGGGMASGLGGGSGAERSEGVVEGAGGWTSGVTGDPGDRSSAESRAGAEDIPGDGET